MASRHADWFRQGQRDLAHARRATEDGDYEWACFAAQQGAEKAVKAVFQKIGAEAWGHSVTVLLEALPNSSAFEPDLLDAAKDLDKHYIPARYPNSHPQGAPFEYYTRGEASRAVSNADKIIASCSGLLFEPPQDDPAASAGDGDVEESASRD